ncbi:AAA family ATPase [Desulfobacterales bacterium HSG17]|nr:AAA family ATPase [Desulfobacterales bacterium HSG17]
MALIEGFRIQNYRALKDIAMGRIGTDKNLKSVKPLTPLTAVIGKNGSGKSSIFDAFGFLADCMDSDLETACNARGRGGYDRIITNNNEDESVKITVDYQELKTECPITYEIEIGKDKNGLPAVKLESLKQQVKNKKETKAFLYLKNGKGNVWIGENTLECDESQKKEVEFDPHKLAIVSLAEQFSENPRIAKLKKFIKSWYLSYFYPEAARQIPQAGVQKHLNLHGDNMGNVVQYLEKNNPFILKQILKDISEKIPGIKIIKTHRDEITNNLYLLFQDKGFARPFTQQQMSDGTLKMFCYMLLLQNPDPPPFICIEEPENGLYHKLLETLVSEFRLYTTDKKGGSQIFITTHQPYLIDALESDEVWVLEKGQNGISKIKRASEYAYVQSMTDQGQPLGSLWYSNYLDAG